MEVQSFLASQPVTAGAPGGAGLVPGGRGEGLAVGTDVGEMTGARVVVESVGVTVAGPGAAVVGWTPGCARCDDAPHAARPATAAPARASLAISVVLTPQACDAPPGPESSRSPFPGAEGHHSKVRQQPER